METYNWKDFLKLIPIIYVYIVFVSFCAQSIFYMYFKIKISDYLELNEILISFLSHALYYFLFTFCMFIYLNFLANKFIGKYGKRLQKSLTDFQKTFTKHPKQILISDWHIWIIFLVILIIIGAVYLKYAISKNVWIDYAIATTLVPILLIITTFIVNTIFTKKIKNTLLRGVVWLAIMLWILIAYTSIIEVNNVKERKGIYITEIEYKNQIIKSDSNIYCIGKTNKYIFFYNQVENQTTAFALEFVGYIK